MPRNPSGGRGRGRPRGSTNKSKMMSKVSKKGAYRKQVKDQMMLRRAPLVETKQRVDSDIAAINGNVDENDFVQPLAWKPLQLNNAFTQIPMECFTRNSQGLSEWQMLGQAITSKFLNLKTQFRFPNNSYILKASGGDIDKPAERNLNVMVQNQCRLYLICGWVTKDAGFPLVNNNSGVSSGVATQNMLNTYIKDQVKPYFDDDTDKLLFRPKQTTNIKIEKYVRVKPNLNSDIATQAVPITESVVGDEDGNAHRYQTPAHGSIPDVYRSHSFKTGKKVVYTLGQPSVPNNTGGYTGDTQNFYPNDSWLPFAVIYNPDWEEQLKQYAPNPDTDKTEYDTQVCQIQYRFNCAHYYTDS